MKCEAWSTGLVLIALTAACHSGAQTTQPATQPAAHSDPVDSWLDRIEHRSAQIATLQARLRYDRIQVLVGDEQRRFGKLFYEAGPPARFAIHFDKLVTDQNRLERQDRWYIFDGRWLVERLDDQKQYRKYEIIPPDAEPEQADPLALGQGPFAVPLDFRKDRVLQRFEASLVAPADDDPPDTVHLHLVPKPGFGSDVTEIDLWYDRQSLLPVRARTIDESENEAVIDLTRPRVNEPVDPTLFDTSVPKARGWLVEIKPWEEGE
ncbi:MAG: outer membrane lipoprotein carrier protein LolA [Phycisphaeraceae bacterium]